MKKTIIASLALVGLVAFALIGCGQQSSPPPPPPPPPAAQAPAPAAPAPAAPAQPSLEVTQHLKQGMAYVSTAKNANSPGVFNENINNAINEFSNAIKKDPGYATAYSNRSVAYMMQKKYNLALDDLKKAKELKPGDAAVRYNMASCHSLMGNVDLAFVERLRLPPERPRPRQHEEAPGLEEDAREVQGVHQLGRRRRTRMRVGTIGKPGRNGV